MRIDFHSHILPGIDDGSRSVEESIGMLKMEAQQGIDHVLATPHFYAGSDTPDRFLRRRQEAQLRLQERLQEHPGLPQVSIGAEVHYFRGISESDRLLDLTFANKRFILLEMPMAAWTDHMFQEIEQIYLKQEVVPVIAHIDRYIGLFQNHGVVRRLSEMPVLIQANAGFFLRPLTRNMALRMLRQHQIHLLGSDCHNLESRPPKLGPAFQLIEKHLGGSALERIGQCGEEVLFG